MLLIFLKYFVKSIMTDSECLENKAKDSEKAELTMSK